jgi:hypothetical protein
MLNESLRSQPVYARIPAMVLYAQTERIEVASAPSSPGAGPFMMDFYEPRIMWTVEPAAHHTAECCHPAKVLTLRLVHCPMSASSSSSQALHEGKDPLYLPRRMPTYLP